jgi:hypothetical protein
MLPYKRMRHVELDEGSAFVPDSRHGFVPFTDGDAEAFGEEFIASATSGEAVGEDARNESDGAELMEFELEPTIDEP